ncbi:MAG: PAS domain S-box protein [bacterium]|nr:PAS domain S-box protein [bacterium]
MVYDKIPADMTIEELRREYIELKGQLKEKEDIQKEKDRRKDLDYKNRYYAIFNNIADPVFIYDSITFKFLHCNNAVFDTYGYTREEILEMNLFDLHSPDEFEAVKVNVDKRITRALSTTHLTKNGEERLVEMKSEQVYFDDHSAWMIIVHDLTERIAMERQLHEYKNKLEAMVNERTLELLMSLKKLRAEAGERKKTELAIIKSEKKFRSIIEKSLDGIFLVNEEGFVIEWNDAQQSIFGVHRNKALGRKIWDVQFGVLPKEKRNDAMYKELKNFWTSFLETGIAPFKNNLLGTRIERSDGSVRDLQQLFFSIGTDKGSMMACTTRDITTKLAMEKNFSQSQKMEAMGKLAGGIAHDFNNMLGGIIGYTELAMRKTAKRSAGMKYMNEVLTAGKRASELVKQILIFSRREEKQKEPVRMSLIVKEALKLLHSSIPAPIELVAVIEAENRLILADSTQIHQIIMNLCTNAAHAMKGRDGIIEVKLVDEDVDAHLYKGLGAGLHLRLTISDTGCGMKQEILDQIFEPFFTTKAEGEGTGMGLAVVHGIVQSHDGYIGVYSEEGEGTTFSILLPVITAAVNKQAKESDVILGGHERILLVEDDAMLAEAEEKMLQELGYDVTVMKSGSEAAEIFSRVPHHFDIVITDYAMTRMTGTQLIRHIREIRTDIPVILCTGFSNVTTPEEMKELDIGTVIMKPLDLEHTANTIRKLLAKGKPKPHNRPLK